tara:strand:- start:748 stop:927 length:180 start_codon:yes stop_codon:yes gene_type:complete
MKKYNVTELSPQDSININGGGWLEGVFEIVKTVVKYSSLTGAFITGVGDGIIEGLENNE